MFRQLGYKCTPAIGICVAGKFISALIAGVRIDQSDVCRRQIHLCSDRRDIVVVGVGGPPRRDVRARDRALRGGCSSTGVVDLRRPGGRLGRSLSPGARFTSIRWQQSKEYDARPTMDPSYHCDPVSGRILLAERGYFRLLFTVNWFSSCPIPALHVRDHRSVCGRLRRPHSVVCRSLYFLRLRSLRVGKHVPNLSRPDMGGFSYGYTQGFTHCAGASVLLHLQLQHVHTPLRVLSLVNSGHSASSSTEHLLNGLFFSSCGSLRSPRVSLPV